MTMRMEAGAGLHMEMRPSPSLIAFTEILQLSGMELQNLIMDAVAMNPALELEETELCPACGDPLLANGTCMRCRHGDDLAKEVARSLVETDEEEFDIFTRVADQMSLSEHLLADLAAVLDPDDLPIAEYLVGELDERGFLELDLDIVAASLGVAQARVENVLARLQEVGPLGIGARSVEECLQLQLDRWEEMGVGHPLARTLVMGHLEELAMGKYSALARQLGATYDEVMAARDFIRTHLRPYPVAEQIDMAPWERQEGPGMIAPDVVVRLGKDDVVHVEIVESRRYMLSISPLYHELLVQLEPAAAQEGHNPVGASPVPVDPATAPAAGSLTTHMSTEERRHVLDQVARAQQFLSHIRERRDTVRRVTAYVMARQTAFLRYGPRQLVPLTRAEVAEALNLHESTVSRATAGKYVLLPNRHVVPFANFFKAALSVQDVLREMVDNETKPLTDAELSKRLTQRGFPVARRTVAKYRDQMGILPAALR